MTKRDIVDVLYEKTNIKKKELCIAVDIFIDEIKNSLLRREAIKLRGLGTFGIKTRKARKNARNPKTGENIAFGPQSFVVFKVNNELKEAVKKLTDVKEKETEE